MPTRPMLALILLVALVIVAVIMVGLNALGIDIREIPALLTGE